MPQIRVWKMKIKGTQFILDELEFSPQLDTFDRISAKLPGGAYTTFRTFEHNNALRLENHFSRLEHTAELAECPVSFSHEQVRGAIRQILSNFLSYEDTRIRVSVDLEKRIGELFLLVEPLSIPSEKDYQKGVGVVTCDLQRHNPKAKLTDHIKEAINIRKDFTADINEALLISEDGHILEGISSNFFAIKDGRMYTAEKGILYGITRSLVLEEAHKLSIPVIFNPICISQTSELDETFITSSSRAILPVVRIESKLIGNGKPGEITKKLMKSYANRVRSEVKSI